MAWCLTGDKSLSELMVAFFYWRIYASLGSNELSSINVVSTGSCLCKSTTFANCSFIMWKLHLIQIGRVMLAFALVLIAVYLLFTQCMNGVHQNYNAVIMSEITNNSPVCSTICWGKQQWNTIASYHWPFKRAMHQCPVESNHQAPMNPPENVSYHSAIVSITEVTRCLCKIKMK